MNVRDFAKMIPLHWAAAQGFHKVVLPWQKRRGQTSLHLLVQFTNF